MGTKVAIYNGNAMKTGCLENGGSYHEYGYNDWQQGGCENQAECGSERGSFLLDCNTW